MWPEDYAKVGETLRPDGVYIAGSVGVDCFDDAAIEDVVGVVNLVGDCAAAGGHSGLV
ncbi:hypothetical protein AB1L30_00085 [Bremerella sp. JC817]|uniref:hypothetical protein n=1 Tax=Bremerella sp. JC817 TaxID=3231756 RepID=UPI00345ACA34